MTAEDAAANVRDKMRREQECGPIVRELFQLGDVERRMVGLLVHRLREGMTRFGPWNRRGWNTERNLEHDAIEEAADGFLYLTRLLVARDTPNVGG